MVLAGLFGGADGGAAAGLMGGGAVAVILGVSLFSPRLVRPLASIAGRPLERLRRLTGRLARENTQRNPARTAVTAAALMIGLAVVAFVTVFAAGIKSSIATAVDESFQGELVIQNSDGFSPISPRAAAPPARCRASSWSRRCARPRRSCSTAAASRASPPSPATPARCSTIDWTEGGPETLRRSTDGQVIVDKAFASGNDLDARRQGPLPHPDRRKARARGGRRVRRQGRPARQRDRHPGPDGARSSTSATTSSTSSSWRPGPTPDKVQATLAALMERDFPAAEVRNQQELKENQEEQINQLLGLIYALLALAVIVSLFGIANTLALSIHERTRELGMLRAIGMSRRQVRTMIRYEAVITALIGALLGMVLGVIFAALIAQPLKDEGFALSYPVGSLIVMLVFAALAGVIAAIPPARRASRLDMLEALQYE